MSKKKLLLLTLCITTQIHTEDDLSQTSLIHSAPRTARNAQNTLRRVFYSTLRREQPKAEIQAVGRTERTLAIIKPDATSAGLEDAIMEQIEKHDFTIVKQKRVRLTREQAAGFYAEHKERPFFNDLITFMTSNDVIIMILEKENAVAAWRNTMGPTNPNEAAEGTIRKSFGASKERNATHGADSPESADREIAYFFGETAIFS